MAVNSYQMAVAQGRRSGQAGRVVPSGPAGNITYRFVPSGGGGGGTVISGGAGTSGIGATALAALKKAKAQYEPGGGFGAGVEAGLERGRIKTMASGMQGLVSAGLAGTTMAGTLGKKYEEEVAAPTRAGLEEERARVLSGISMQEAGMGFQASESAASRSLQMYIANLQAGLQRRPTVSMRAPTTVTPTGGYARQFPSLYSAMNEPAPPMPGDGGIDKYAGMTGNLISDVEWADIQTQAGRLG